MSFSIGSIAGGRRRGGGTSPVITAPVLTQTSTAGTSPFTWDEALDATAFAGLRRRLQVASDSGFATLLYDLYKPITESETAGNDTIWGSGATDSPPRDYTTDAITYLGSLGGSIYVRERLERDDGVNSAWSNVLHDTINTVTRWFLQINSNGRDDSNSTAIGNIVFRATAGGADLAASGTPFGDSSNSVAWGPDKAFDANAATHYTSTSPTTAHPKIGLTFGSGPAALHDFDIQNTTNADGLVQYIWGPTNFDLYKTIGGVDTFVQNFTTAGWTVEGETRNFVVTA